MLLVNGVIFAPLSWKRGVLGERPGDFLVLGRLIGFSAFGNCFFGICFFAGLGLGVSFSDFVWFFFAGFFFVSGFLGEFIDILRRYYI